MLEAHLKEESLNPLDTFYKSSLSPYLIFHRI